MTTHVTGGKRGWRARIQCPQCLEIASRHEGVRRNADEGVFDEPIRRASAIFVH